MYTKKDGLKIIYFILIILILVSLNSISFADNDINKMDNKIDKQNEELFERILENIKDEPNDLDEIFKESDKNNTEEPRDINLKNIASGIQKGSILLAIKARKYIVPITILALFFNIFMLSATGAKSIKNRKKYILSSIFFYIFFLIILNFPLYLLWRSSIGNENLLGFDGFYRTVKGISDFLRSNSFVISTIIFAFGAVNKISSETNLPNKLASEFMIKMSFILLVLFNMMPFILKLAV